MSATAGWVASAGEGPPGALARMEETETYLDLHQSPELQRSTAELKEFEKAAEQAQLYLLGFTRALTMAPLTTALLAMALVTTALLTMALLTVALPTMALLTTALLFMRQAVIEHAEATLDGGNSKGNLEVAWLDRTLPLALQTHAGSLSLRKLEP